MRTSSLDAVGLVRLFVSWIGLGLWSSLGCTSSDEPSVGGAELSLLADGGEAEHEHEHPAADGGTVVAPPDDDAGAEPPPEVDPGTEHCHAHGGADPRDATLDPAPVLLAVGSAQDVLMPQPIIDWMEEQGWIPAHDSWHSQRRWDARCDLSFASAEGCTFAERLAAEGLWRARYQQGAPGSGLAFLAMHRHMLGMFRAAFPSHPELFAGFGHVPRTQDDSENPTPWRALRWSEDNLIGFDVLEHIEDHLDRFPTDDDLGLYIESTVRWSPEDPAARVEDPGAAVHGALHRQWTVNRSPASLGGTDTALRNYTFWKLHGFIDDVWTRYRSAKGASDTEPDYAAVALEECRLMYYLIPSHRAEAPSDIRQ
ncbi:MAG TPA: hypothetical protein VJR89_39440 [Polyangiales bacterium]|nr:hypothetical protein [Polyangiales bacterium]